MNTMVTKGTSTLSIANYLCNHRDLKVTARLDETNDIPLRTLKEFKLNNGARRGVLPADHKHEHYPFPERGKLFFVD